MSIVFRCPLCDLEHPSRLVARCERSFQEIFPQLGEVLEVCPETREWAPLRFSDLTWKGEEALVEAGG